MKRFRGGLVFKAHSLVYHSTLDLRVIQKRGRDIKPLPAEARNTKLVLQIYLLLIVPLNPEHWDPKPETCNSKLETRILQAETRNPKPETLNLQLDARHSHPNRNPTPET